MESNCYQDNGVLVAFYRDLSGFDSSSVQKAASLAYSKAKKREIMKEFCENTPNSLRLDERTQTITYLRALKNCQLAVYDVWCLSLFPGELVRMFSCLLKNGVSIVFLSQKLEVNAKSDALLVLGLLDKAREDLLSMKQKKEIGRPKGKLSRSKFDVFQDEIVLYLQEGKNVSEISRLLNVSRSSLKDYVESRSLKEIAQKQRLSSFSKKIEKEFLKTIECPDKNRS